MSDSSNNAQSSFNPGASAKSRRIVFTGGGSAGHVTLNLALIPWFLEQGWQEMCIRDRIYLENGGRYDYQRT